MECQLCQQKRKQEQLQLLLRKREKREPVAGERNE